MRITISMVSTASVFPSGELIFCWLFSLPPFRDGSTFSACVWGFCSGTSPVPRPFSETEGVLFLAFFGGGLFCTPREWGQGFPACLFQRCFWCFFLSGGFRFSTLSGLPPGGFFKKNPPLCPTGGIFITPFTTGGFLCFKSWGFFFRSMEFSFFPGFSGSILKVYS